MKRKKLRCSFCGLTEDDVQILPGLEAAICVNCINVAHAALSEAESKEKKRPLPQIGPVPSAKEIKKFLDQYVIGQDETKKILSVAVHNHYRRLEAQDALDRRDPGASKKKGGGYVGRLDDVEIEKANILLVGPTGSGKTLFAKSLAKMLGVPYAIGDATVLTQAGYVGEDVENLVRYLVQNADGNIELAKRGIIYIDEIDKIASKTDNVSITRDVGGEGVQQALLKIIEGTICRIPPKGGRKHPDQEYLEVDTTNILFICGGAFVGLDKIISARTGKSVIGFDLSKQSEKGEKEAKSPALKDVRPEDLVKFGLIPEFIGRLPVVTAMNELTKEELVRILTEPKNSLVKQYQKLLSLDGIELEFEKPALEALARKAIELRTGARGLRAEMERFMTDIMYNAPGSAKTGKVKLTVTAEMVQG